MTTPLNVQVRNVLQKSKIGRCEVIGPHHEGLGRITAVFPLVFRKRSILLVRSAKGGNWIFPQGGFRKEVEKILSQTARRECSEELNFKGRIHDFEVELGACRNEGGKYLCFLALRVMFMGQINLNLEENDKYEWVDSWSQFRTLVDDKASEHPVKTAAMYAAVHQMIALKMLDWLSEEPVMN